MEADGWGIVIHLEENQKDGLKRKKRGRSDAHKKNKK
jgi:hypothetical protein